MASHIESSVPVYVAKDCLIPFGQANLVQTNVLISECSNFVIMFLASSTFHYYSKNQPYVDKCEYFIRPSTNQTIRLLVRFINTWYKECMLELWFVFHTPNKKMKLQYWDCSMTRTTKGILDYLIAFLKRNKYKLLAVA